MDRQTYSVDSGRPYLNDGGSSSGRGTFIIKCSKNLLISL